MPHFSSEERNISRDGELCPQLPERTVDPWRIENLAVGHQYGRKRGTERPAKAVSVTGNGYLEQ
jgi:hypothetical protein